MHVASFCVNPFQMNCLVVHDGGEGVLIDPGTYAPSERLAVLEYIEREDLVLREILLTHGHVDHVLELAYFTGRFEVGYRMHGADLPLIEDAAHRASTYGLQMAAPGAPSGFLDEGDRVRVGALEWEVLHVPGHSPGSIAFVDHENSFVVSGDVLFRGSVGRTDLWKGSMEELMHSIETKILTLPDEYVVYCGHGPATTIGEERRQNPFLTQTKKGA